MRRLLTFLLLLLAVAAPALAVEEAVQVRFLKDLFRQEQANWIPFMEQNRNVLDDTFIDRCDKRIRWDVQNQQVEDSIRFALVADWSCRVTGRQGGYRLALAEMFGKAGNTDLMEDILKNILLDEPNNQPAKFVMAIYTRTSKMDLFQAWTMFDELQKGGYRRAECLYQMAMIDLVTEHEDRGAQELDECLKADPNHALAKAEWEKLNRSPSAVVSPANVTVSNEGRERGKVMFNQAEASLAAGHFEDAQNFYLKAIQADPKLVKAYVYLGALYYRLGSVDAAIKWLSQAVLVDDKDFEGWRYLGNSMERRYDQKGNKADLDEAVADYQKALLIQPDDRIVKGELDRAMDKKGPSANR